MKHEHERKKKTKKIVCGRGIGGRIGEISRRVPGKEFLLVLKERALRQKSTRLLDLASTT
eukprot:COSAG05_NODE_14749_length_388_cov_0.705882_1_plen_59_part_01